MPGSFYRIANRFYSTAFPIYRPVYSLFKAISDRAERALLRKIIQPGMTVVDAGANIGIYSLFLAQLAGPRGQVHAFEPSAENFRRLASAVRGCPQARAIQAAVGDATGQLTLYVSDDLNVDHRTYAIDDPSRREVRVPCVRLDDHFAPGQQVDFIKMDIQGYEMHALRGMERVLADSPRIGLLLEFWPFGLRAAGGSAAELIAFLTSRGFQLSVLGKNGGQIPLDPAAAECASETWYCNVYVSRHCA
jgi:FkbM family methyltransferase